MLSCHFIFQIIATVKPSRTTNESETTREESKPTTIEPKANINRKNFRKNLISDNSLKNNENSAMI